MFFSPSTNGFYTPEIHGSAIPSDAVEVSSAEHDSLIGGSAQGKEIRPDANGHPALVDPAPPTIEQLQVLLMQSVQTHMDAAAKALGYDNLLSAVSYADEPSVPTFQAQGQAFRAWRSAVWAQCYVLLAEVQAETRPVPTAEELLALLPVLNLP